MGVRKVIAYPDLNIAIECLPEGFLFVTRQTFLLYIDTDFDGFCFVYMYTQT